MRRPGKQRGELSVFPAEEIIAGGTATKQEGEDRHRDMQHRGPGIETLTGKGRSGHRSMRTENEQPETT